MKEGRFVLDIRKELSAMRGAILCHMFPREVVDALTLVLFKDRLNAPLSNLIKWEVPLHMAEMLD